MLKLLLISALFLIGGLASLPAADYRPRVHAAKGLNVAAITEGPDGMIWLASSAGVFRFDGLHFLKAREIPFASADSLGVTADGSVWVGGQEGMLRCRSGCRKVLDQPVLGLVDFADKVVVREGYRVVRAGTDGSVRKLPSPSISWRIARGPANSVTVMKATSTTVTVEVMDADTFGERSRTTVPGATQAGFSKEVAPAAGGPGARDGLWVLRPGSVELTGADGNLLAKYTRRQNDALPGFALQPGRDGEIWLADQPVRGLATGRVLEDPAFSDQYRATAVYEDRRGHVWVARQGLGLVEWTPESGWERWSSEALGTPGIEMVTRSADGQVVAVGKQLYRLNSHQTWEVMTSKEREYDYLLPMAGGGFWASIRDIGLARLSPSGAQESTVTSGLPAQRDYKRNYRQLLTDALGRTWIGHKNKLQRLDTPAGALRILELPHQELPHQGKVANPVALELDAKGQVWVGFGDGVGWFDEQDQFHSVPTSERILEVRSFSLADSDGRDIWVTHRKSGQFSRLQKQGETWRVTRFEASAGYGPPDSMFIRRDSRGWIWRGASDGVHVADGIHFAAEDWIHISPSNGLATDDTGQYGFFEDSDGTVWISGSRGITHISPDVAWFMSREKVRAPRVTRIEVDGKEYSEATLQEAELRKADVMRIDIGSLSLPSFRTVPFRYRLAPRSNEWVNSIDGVLEFHDLRPQAYMLEVAYNGMPGAPILQYPFRVGAPVWRSAWIWLLSPLLGSGVLAWLFRRTRWVEGIWFQIERTIFVLLRRMRPWETITGGAGSKVVDRSGEVLDGRYELLHPVSEGGFSVVYDAHDRKTGNQVAVKVLNHGFGRDAWLRGRFAHEVAALSSVRHPSVVPILDSWMAPDGAPCLVMPLLDGPTLAMALEAGPFPPGKVARITRALAAGLAAIHARGIVHRDLKPENVILTGEGEDVPVLVDFGTAGLRGALERNTSTTLLAGSLHYMAPERLTGHFSAASNAYSLGVMVLEMLTGLGLADVAAATDEEGFEKALAAALGGTMQDREASDVARHLKPLLSQSPGSRPTDLVSWSRVFSELADRN